VRILHSGKPQTIDHAWWQARLEQPLPAGGLCFASAFESSAAECARSGRSNADMAVLNQFTLPAYRMLLRRGRAHFRQK